MRGRTDWGTWVSFIPSLPCLRVCSPGPPESLDLGSAALLPQSHRETGWKALSLSLVGTCSGIPLGLSSLSAGLLRWLHICLQIYEAAPAFSIIEVA